MLSPWNVCIVASSARVTGRENSLTCSAFVDRELGPQLHPLGTRVLMGSYGGQVARAGREGAVDASPPYGAFHRSLIIRTYLLSDYTLGPFTHVPREICNVSRFARLLD